MAELQFIRQLINQRFLATTRRYLLDVAPAGESRPQKGTGAAPPSVARQREDTKAKAANRQSGPW